MPFDPTSLSSATDVERAAVDLYGDPLRVRPALSHVAAVWSPGDGRHRVMKITDRTPSSATDVFVLQLARARADALLTTGAILRAEPDLKFDLTGPGSMALMRWRVEVHGLMPPSAAILTSGRDFDPTHPALFGPAHAVVFTSADVADGIRRQMTSFKWAKVQGVVDLTAADAIGWLRRERDAASVSIEAGPSTALALYDDPGVDELLLSRYTGDLDADLVAGDFFDDAALGTHLRRASATDVDADGWTFERWVRD